MLAKALTKKMVLTQKECFSLPMDIADEMLAYVQKTIQLIYMMLRVQILLKSTDKHRINNMNHYVDLQQKLRTTFML
jgi:hypothetical protein